MALSIEDILHLLSTRGQAQYGRETVTQLDHALQCARLAEENNEPPELIVAALLHISAIWSVNVTTMVFMQNSSATICINSSHCRFFAAYSPMQC